jgi:hypothetical protein
MLVKSDDSIFGTSTAPDDSPVEPMWTVVQQRIANLLDQGQYLNGPLDPAVSTHMPFITTLIAGNNLGQSDPFR